MIRARYTTGDLLTVLTNVASNDDGCALYVQLRQNDRNRRRIISAAKGVNLIVFPWGTINAH